MVRFVLDVVYLFGLQDRDRSEKVLPKKLLKSLRLEFIAGLNRTDHDKCIVS